MIIELADHEARITTRTGKIARLPEDTRHCVNQLLRNGVQYSTISARLADLGYPGISPQNICNWKQGGFIDWYRDTLARESRVAPLNALDHCTRSHDAVRWQQNAVTFVAEKFASIMANLDESRLLKLLYEKPELLPKYIAAMNSMSRTTTQLAGASDIIRQQDNL